MDPDSQRSTVKIKSTIQETAKGIGEISNHITRAAQAAKSTTDGAVEIQNSAGGLLNVASEL